MLQLVIDNIQFIFWKDRTLSTVHDNFAQLAVSTVQRILLGRQITTCHGRREQKLFRHESDPIRGRRETILNVWPCSGLMVNRWLGTNKVPLHDSEGNVVSILGTFADITSASGQRKNCKAKARREAANQARQIHSSYEPRPEIRTPLNA